MNYLQFRISLDVNDMADQLLIFCQDYFGMQWVQHCTADHVLSETLGVSSDKASNALVEVTGVHTIPKPTLKH